MTLEEMTIIICGIGCIICHVGMAWCRKNTYLKYKDQKVRK